MPGLYLSRPVLYPNELDRVLNKPGGPVGVKMRKIALDIAKTGERIGKAELGIHPGDQPRTGRYATSFTVTVEFASGSPFQFVVRNTADYAAIIEKGSKPHLIRARRVTHLRFKGRDGRWRQTTVVKHPGTVARHILWRATREAVDRSNVASAFGLG